jgi:hypothetical protein
LYRDTVTNETSLSLSAPITPAALMTLLDKQINEGFNIAQYLYAEADSQRWGNNLHHVHLKV